MTWATCSHSLTAEVSLRKPQKGRWKTCGTFFMRRSLRDTAVRRLRAGALKSGSSGWILALTYLLCDLTSMSLSFLICIMGIKWHLLHRVVVWSKWESCVWSILWSVWHGVKMRATEHLVYTQHSPESFVCVLINTSNNPKIQMLLAPSLKKKKRGGNWRPWEVKWQGKVAEPRCEPMAVEPSSYS